jgi:GAF domain-containing protein
VLNEDREAIAEVLADALVAALERARAEEHG